MAEIASAYVTLIPSFRGGSAAISREFDGAATTAGKSSGRRMGAGMAAGVGALATKVFAPLAAAAAAVGIAGFFKDAVNAASDLNEATTKTEAIFGKAGAAAVDAFASKGAKALGQTKLEVVNAAATFGTFGKAAGKSGQDLAKFSTGFASLSTDLASFYNTSPEEAVTAIGAALRGESEPIRQYGVLLDDATLRQEALKQGLIKTTKQALTPQQKVLAAQAAIYKQTKDAQGDFQKTSGGLANQQRILSAQFSDFKATVGSALLPIVTKFVTFLNDNMIPAFKAVGDFVGPAISKVADAFGYLFNDTDSQGFAEVIDNVFGNSGKLVPALRGAGDVILQIKDGFASFFNVLRGGQGSTTGISGAFTTFATFIRGQLIPAVMGVVNAFRGYLAVIIPIVQQFVAGMMARLAPLLPAIRMIFSTIGQIVVGAMNLIQAIIGRVTSIVAGIWNRWGSNIMSFISTVFGHVLTIIQGALNIIKGVIKTVTSVIRGDWSGAWDGIKQIVKGAWDVIKGVVQGAISIVKGILQGAWAVIKTAASAAWDALKNIVSRALEAIIVFVKGLPGKIVAILRGLGSTLLNLGSEIINGLAQGIRNGIGRVIQAARDLASNIPGPIKKVLGIASPSKVTKALGHWVGMGLVEGMTGTSKQVKAAASKLAQNISGGLERRIADEVRSLRSLAGKREAVAARLKSAQKKLTDAVKVRDDYSKSVRESFSQFGQITGLGSSEQIIRTLEARVEQARQFRTDLIALQRAGLSKTAYKQIVDAGPEQGAATARALIEGGVNDVRRVNSLLGQITQAGGSVATTAASSLYQAGVESAKGLIKGLQSQSSALAAAAKRIAKSLVSQVRKSLGIRSPSRVFASEVGAHIPTGVVAGIDATQNKLTSRLSTLATPPRLSGLTPAATQAGMPAGDSERQRFIQDVAEAVYRGSRDGIGDREQLQRARQVYGSSNVGVS